MSNSVSKYCDTDLPVLRMRLGKPAELRSPHPSDSDAFSNHPDLKERVLCAWLGKSLEVRLSDLCSADHESQPGDSNSVVCIKPQT